MGGSAPLNLVHGRPVATLDGGVRAVVDTAGAAILLAQSTADDLELQVIETIEEGGEVFTVLEPPSLSAGGYALDTDGLPAYGFEDARAVGLTADGLDLVLPASLLQRHAVVLDALGDGTTSPRSSTAASSTRVCVAMRTLGRCRAPNHERTGSSTSSITTRGSS